MNRKFVIVAVVVGVAALVGAACAKKAGPGETPVSAEHGERTVPGALHGAVRSAAGKPVVGVLVAATSMDDPPRPVPEVAVITDGDGGYEWPLAPGRYRLNVSSPSGVGSGEIEVRVGVANDLDIVVAP